MTISTVLNRRSGNIRSQLELARLKDADEQRRLQREAAILAAAGQGLQTAVQGGVQGIGAFAGMLEKQEAQRRQAEQQAWSRKRSEAEDLRRSELHRAQVGLTEARTKDVPARTKALQDAEVGRASRHAANVSLRGREVALKEAGSRRKEMDADIDALHRAYLGAFDRGGEDEEAVLAAGVAAIASKYGTSPDVVRNAVSDEVNQTFKERALAARKTKADVAKTEAETEKAKAQTSKFGAEAAAARAKLAKRRGAKSTNLKPKLPASQQKSFDEYIIQTDTTLNRLSRVKELADESYTGKFDDAVAKFRSWTGVDEVLDSLGLISSEREREVEFRRLILEDVNRLLHEQGGAVIPTGEEFRLKAPMPTPADSSVEFNRKLDAVIRELQQQRAAVLRIKGANYNVDYAREDTFGGGSAEPEAPEAPADPAKPSPNAIALD